MIEQTAEAQAAKQAADEGQQKAEERERAEGGNMIRVSPSGH